MRNQYKRIDNIGNRWNSNLNSYNTETYCYWVIFLQFHQLYDPTYYPLRWLVVVWVALGWYSTPDTPAPHGSHLRRHEKHLKHHQHHHHQWQHWQQQRPRHASTSLQTWKKLKTTTAPSLLQITTIEMQHPRHTRNQEDLKIRAHWLTIISTSAPAHSSHKHKLMAPLSPSCHLIILHGSFSS